MGRLLALAAMILAGALGGCADPESANGPTEIPNHISSTPIVTPECPASAEPFLIEPEEAFEEALEVQEPALVSAEAYWETGPERLALFLSGPERDDLENPEAPYERRDGPSGLLGFDFTIEGPDLERGSDWQVRIANFGNTAAAGCLQVQTASVSAPTATPGSPSGLYQVVYSKTRDTCGNYPERFTDTLDVRIQEEQIATHQASTGDDTAGTISGDGAFTTSGTGATHLETYDGTLEDGEMSAVNSFVQLGCEVEYTVEGARQ